MLIGHNKNKKYFTNLIDQGSLGHAYIFSGPDMIGKKTFALDIFELANKRNRENDPDLISISSNIAEGESKIYIEDIRKLKSFFHLKPYYGPHKFAVIDGADRLTPEASNALLKLLEEPPKFSVIILVSSFPKLIPATILSRCESVKFREANEKEILGYLEGKKISNTDREFIVKLAQGRIGFIDKFLSSEEIKEAKKAIDDLRQLLGHGVFERMNYAKKVHEKGDYRPRIDYWLSWVSAHLKASPKNEKIVKNLLFLTNIISQPQNNHRLALENFLLNL